MKIFITFFISVLIGCRDSQADSKIIKALPPSKVDSALLDSNVVIYRDSIFYETYCDTVYGKIEIKRGNGTIVGSGYSARCETYEYKTTVPETDHAFPIVSNGDTTGWEFNGSTGVSRYISDMVWLKINGEMKPFFDPYILTPFQ